MSETTIIILIVAFFALSTIIWLLYLAAGLVLVFTAFVMELPTIVAIIMFILFPPTLIVYLVGLAFIHFGVADALESFDDGTEPSESEYKLSKRDLDEAKARRRALGYDD